MKASFTPSPAHRSPTHETGVRSKKRPILWAFVAIGPVNRNRSPTAPTPVLESISIEFY